MDMLNMKHTFFYNYIDESIQTNYILALLPERPNTDETLSRATGVELNSSELFRRDLHRTANLT